MGVPEEFAPESEAEYNERARELIEDAKQTKEELEAEQQEALEAIRSGGDIERYETVELGELELEVRAWIPGSVSDTIQRAQALGETEDMAQIKESMETMLSALDEMTTSETYNMGFWRAYYDEYGPEGLLVAVETILEPATESLENREEAVTKFRENR